MIFTTRNGRGTGPDSPAFFFVLVPLVPQTTARPCLKLIYGNIYTNTQVTYINNWSKLIADGYQLTYGYKWKILITDLYQQMMINLTYINN